MTVEDFVERARANRPFEDLQHVLDEVPDDGENDRRWEDGIASCCIALAGYKEITWGSGEDDSGRGCRIVRAKNVATRRFEEAYVDW